jgi:hypothetical protein
MKKQITSTFTKYREIDEWEPILKTDMKFYIFIDLNSFF